MFELQDLKRIARKHNRVPEGVDKNGPGPRYVYHADIAQEHPDISMGDISNQIQILYSKHPGEIEGPGSDFVIVVNAFSE
jgi:hypothetical protein